MPLFTVLPVILSSGLLGSAVTCVISTRYVHDADRVVVGFSSVYFSPLTVRTLSTSVMLYLPLALLKEWVVIPEASS